MKKLLIYGLPGLVVLAAGVWLFKNGEAAADSIVVTPGELVREVSVSGKVTPAAAVTAIDPAETVRDGVATYKITLQFSELDSRLKSGLTANVVIVTARRENVLLVPLEAVFDRAGKKYVQTRVAGKLRDEPTANLDNLSSRTVMEIFQKLHRAGQTIIMVTHEDEYAKLTQKIVQMDDGRIVSIVNN